MVKHFCKKKLQNKNNEKAKNYESKRSNLNREINRKF